MQREDGRLEHAFAELGLPFNVGLEVSTVDTLKHDVARGLGIGVISSLNVTREDCGHLDIVEIPAEYAGSTTYGITMRRDKHQTPLLKSLVSALRSSPPP